MGRKRKTPIREGHPVHFLDEEGRPYGIPHIDNKPRMSMMPYSHELGMGRVPGCMPMLKFGRNSNIGATWETVWSEGAIYQYLSSAEILKVSSSGADDTAAGDGARTVELFGLDENYLRQSETIALNGLASVATEKRYLRVYRAIVRTSGDNGWNAGTINVKDNADSIVLLTVEPELNQTLMALVTVPMGCTGYLIDWYASASSLTPKLVELAIFIRPFGEVFQIKTHIVISEAVYRDDLKFPMVVNAKSDIEMRGKAAAGGGAISAGFRMWFGHN